MRSSNDTPDERSGAAGPVAPAGFSDTTISFGNSLRFDDAPGAVGLTAEQQAAVAALPLTSALLIMASGGSRFLLDADRTLAGRSERSDIFLDDVTVSRKHAEFVRDGDDFVVRDVGSLNGTYVNRNRIESVVLRANDEVQIGKYRMRFYPSPQSRSESGQAQAGR